MALRRVFMVGTGLLLIAARKRFAEEPIPPSLHERRQSSRPFFAADILIRRSLGSRKIQANFRGRISYRGFVAWHRSARVYDREGRHAHKSFHASHAVRHKKGHAGFTLIELVVVVVSSRWSWPFSRRDARRQPNSLPAAAVGNGRDVRTAARTERAVAQNYPYAVSYPEQSVRH